MPLGRHLGTHTLTTCTLLLTPYTLLLTPYSWLLTTHNSAYHDLPTTAADDAPSVRAQVSAPYDVTLVTGAMLQGAMSSGAIPDKALRDRIHRLHR